MTVERMSDAGSNAYLGDLLYHTNRPDDAVSYLQTALKLEPDLSMANATLGMVLMRQGKFTEAKTFLEKAILDDKTSHVALYRYAFLLSREARDESGMVSGFDKETSTKIHASLNKAIALNPAFTESYELLAFVNLVNKEAFEESLALLKTALKYQPGNQRYTMRAAEILFRLNKLAEASEIAEKIARTTDDPTMKRRAEDLTRYLQQRKEFNERAAARQKAGVANPNAERGRELDGKVSETELMKMQADATLRSINQSLRKPLDGEIRVIGRIQKIACTSGSVVYSIKTSTESFTITSKDFEDIMLNTFEQSANNVRFGCDENISGIDAVITYFATKPVKEGSRGELRSIEFVPTTFRFMTGDELSNTPFVIYELPGETTKTSNAPAKGGSVVTNSVQDHR